MNSYERKRRICKMIVLVLGILSINNIILTIRNYSYAYFHKNVKSDIKLKITTLDKMPSKYAVDTIKETLGRTGGIIAITSRNQKVITEGDDIREYRYTGLNVNNYIYYNCKDSVEQSTSNCEIWRIIGVFKDESGNEHLKIVRNSTLTRDMFPSTYSKNGITYNIKYVDNNIDTTYSYAYWSNSTSSYNETYYNDWATAGLQYWLNAGIDKETKQPSDGYMSYLSKNAKNMIENTKYYLGTVTYAPLNGSINPYGIKNTTNEAYKYERAIECTGGKGSSENNSESKIEENNKCRVWANSNTTWEGSIALLYPSDYGYSADSEYWNTMLAEYKFDVIASSSSWLQKVSSGYTEWLLSPTSNGRYYVANWDSRGFLFHTNTTGRGNVRPCLYLKSEVKIVEGDGTEGNAYQLSL